MGIRYFHLFCCYISAGSFLKALCFVSCTAGAGAWADLAAAGLGLLVNTLVGWETRVTDRMGRIGMGY